MSEKSLNIEVQAVIDDALSKFEQLLSTITSLPEMISSSIVIDSDAAIADVEELSSILSGVDGEQATADIDVNSEEAQNKAEEVMSTVEELDGKNADTEVNLDDNASEGINYVGDELESLDGQSATVHVDVEGSGNIDDAATSLENTNQKASESVNLFDMATGAAGTFVGAVTGLSLLSDSLSMDKYIESSALYWHLNNEGAAELKQRAKELADTIASPGLGQPEILEAFMRMAQLGVPEKEALSQMSSMAQITKRTGVDLNDVVNEGTQILRRYGLSGADANEMLDDLNVAMQRSTLGADQFLRFYGKMSSGMTGWDIKGEDVMGIMKAMEMGGINPQQLQNTFRQPQRAFKEFKENMGGTGKNADGAREALNKLGVSVVKNKDGTVNYGATLMEVSNALGQVEDPTERAALATAIFGEKTGAAFALIKGKPTDYANEIEKDSESISKNLGKVAAANRDAGGWSQWLYDQILSGFNKLPKEGQWAAALGLTVLSGWATTKLYKGLKAIWEDPKGSADDFVKKVKSIPDSIKGVFDRIKSIGKGVWDKLFDGTELGNKITQMAESVKTKLTKFVDDVKGLFSRVFKTGVKTDENGIIKMIQVDEGKYSFEKSKFTNFIDDIKGKVKDLKDSNIFKMLFGDEKGTVNTSFLDDMVSQIKTKLDDLKNSFKTTSIKPEIKVTPDLKIEMPKTSISNSVDDIFNSFKTSITRKLPSLELEGTKIPNSLKNGLSKGLKTVSVSMGAELAGWGAGLAIQLIDSLANMRDVLEDPFKYLGMGQQNLSPVGAFFSKDSIYAQVFPKEVRGILSPANILKVLVGDTKYAQFSDALKKYIEDPMRKALNDSFKDPISLFKPITDKFKNINIISLLMPGLGANTGKDNPVDKFINDLKTKIGGFIPWLQSLKFPNLLDLIFGNNKKDGKDGGGKGGEKTNPLDAFISEIKTKIGGLKAWINTNIPKVPPINWKPLSQGLQDVWTWVTKKYNDLKNFIRNNTPKIPTLPWGNLSKGVRETTKFIQDKWNDLKNFLKDLGPKMKDYGRKIMDGLVAGLKEKMGPFKDIMKYISDHFPKSPPKVGPLSEVTPQGMADYGNLLGHGLTDGLGSSTNNLFGGMGATGALYNAPTSAAAVTNNNDSGITIENVEVSVPESVGSKEEAYLYGQSAGSGFVDQLKNEVTNGGILTR